MKKKLLLFLLFSINSFIYSQEVCGTSTITPASASKKVFTASELAAAQDASYCINVYFHIVRDSYGNGGIQVNQLPSIINNLNQFYNSHNIYFVNAGYDFINNTNYQQIDNIAESENLAQTNNQSNSINYYIVDALWVQPNGGTVLGTAISVLSNRLVIRKDYALSEISSHEMGHCLNLHHTFYGTVQNGDGGCVEAIPRTNCYSCGDKICDTPADNGNYNYDGYNPDLTNIMSYYPFSDHFTPEQGLRMRTAINSYQLLRNTISNSCSVPTLTGSTQFCSNTQGSTYTLQNGGSSVAWQVSPNLQIVSSNNSSITVKPLDSWVVSEAGYIDAILPYQTIRDSVWIGVPYINYGNEDLTMCRDSNTTENNFFRASIKGQDIYTTWQVESITDNHYATMQGDEVLISLNFAPPFNYIAFRVRASNSCGFSEWLQYYIAVINSCENGGSSSFIVYPNPVSTVLNIQENQESSLQKKSGNEVLELKLYDDTGNLKTERKTNKVSGLDMSNLQNGHYFLQIRKNGKLETHKIIKK
jgi:hypothetical protein